MEKVNSFKEFVRKNPNLLKYVRNKEMTWQNFYEIYDLYGEDDSVWNEYLNNNVSSKKNENVNVNFTDFVGMLKKLDLDNLQEGISSVQRVVGVLSDLVLKKNNEVNVNEYKPRPLYKHFDD